MLFQKKNAPCSGCAACMPNMNEQGGQQGEKFVGRFEMAMMQFAILSKAQQQGGVTKENLQQIFRGEMQMTKDHLEHCLNLLVREDHLKQDGNKYTVTDDGREDVQKVQHLVLALPNAVQIGGQTGQQRPTQPVGGGSTGSTVGQQGNVGRSSPQGGGVGAQQGNTQPGNISQKSGVQGQRTTSDVSKGGANEPAGRKGNQ